MGTTKTGFRLNKNGKPITTLSTLEIKVDEYKGKSFKEEGTYYYFIRKQGNSFIYSI